MTKVVTLNSSSQVTQTVVLWYDAFNDLIGRSVTPYTNGNPGTTTTTRFVYDLASADALPLGATGQQGRPVPIKGDILLFCE